MIKNKEYATSVITDIRNFSGIFEKFQYNESDEFIQFLEDYYRIQSELATIISDNIHVSSTGDGVLTIFLSDNHYKEGYAFLLCVHRSLSKLCEEFETRNDISTSFGIGADSGYIWDVGKNLHTKLDTYVGSVINRSSRIESNTKNFGNTKASIGNYLYNKIMEDLYPSEYKKMLEYKGDYDSLLFNNPEIVLLSQEIMLVYIFEMMLRNIETPLPIFRLSESMVNDDKIYWEVISKLLPESKINILKEII